jgi:hypothetical protein
LASILFDHVSGKFRALPKKSFAYSSRPGIDDPDFNFWPDRQNYAESLPVPDEMPRKSARQEGVQKRRLSR